MSDNEPRKDKRAPLIIGGIAIALIAVATYMNYGGTRHHVGSATDLNPVTVASLGVGQ
jgi:hypothetical protein